MKAEHLGDDRWRVRIGAGRDVNGKYRQVQRTFRASSKREAYRIADRVRAELRDELTEERDRRTTVDGAVDDWLLLPRAESTAYRNQSIVREIRATFGGRRLEQLTTRDIDLWYARLLAEGRSPSTVNHYHRVLSAILMQAEWWGRVRFAPTRKARPPKRPRPNPRPPSTDVLAELIADASPTLQMAAILGGRLGLRRGEICGLRWSDIQGRAISVERSVTDIPGQAPTVKPPKNDESIRVVGMDDATLAALELWRAQFPGPADGYILTDPNDPSGMTPRRPGWITQAWSRLCARHGAKVRFHDLRHWSATNMLGAGVPIKTASARLGHSLSSTTVNMYARALPGSDAEAARVLGELLPTPAFRHDGKTAGT